MPSGSAPRHVLISHNDRARPFRRPSQYLVQHGDRMTVHSTLHEPPTGNDQRTGPLTAGETWQHTEADGVRGVVRATGAEMDVYRA
jgi:hypothetical protein